MNECPMCGSYHTKEIVITRFSYDNKNMYNQHGIHCSMCGFQFTTDETSKKTLENREKSILNFKEREIKNMKNKTTLQRLLMAQKNERANLSSFIGDMDTVWGVVSIDNTNINNGKTLEESTNDIVTTTQSFHDRMKSIIDKRFLINKVNNTTKVNIKDFFTGKETQLTIAEVVLLRDTFKETFDRLSRSAKSHVKSLERRYQEEYNRWTITSKDVIAQQDGTNMDDKQKSIVKLMLERHDLQKPELKVNEDFYNSVIAYHEYLSQEIDIVLSEVNSLTEVEI